MIFTTMKKMNKIFILFFISSFLTGCIIHGSPEDMFYYDDQSVYEATAQDYSTYKHRNVQKPPVKQAKKKKKIKRHKKRKRVRAHRYKRTKKRLRRYKKSKKTLQRVKQAKNKKKKRKKKEEE